MTNTKNTLIGLAILFTMVVSLVVYNAFFTFDRKFTLIFSDQFQFCLLMSNDYTYTVSSSEIKYRGKKNNGTMSIKTDGFSEGMVKIKNNGFNAGYRKIKNYRIYEYELAKDTILVDKFEYIEKTPINQVPYRKECEHFKKRFKDHVRVFDE